MSAFYNLALPFLEVWGKHFVLFVPFLGISRKDYFGCLNANYFITFQPSGQIFRHLVYSHFTFHISPNLSFTLLNVGRKAYFAIFNCGKETISEKY